VDNFCWPDIGYDKKNNPDGRFKAAQLVRACRALKDACMAYGIPLLSGKDSMYVDGHLEGAFGERIKVSALETVQFSATSVVNDVLRCQTLAPKASGDRVYVAGITGNELGASEYYDLFGQTGMNVPRVNFDASKVLYRAVEKAVSLEMPASCHAVGRGGLGIHLALLTMAGGLGLEIDLSQAPCASASISDEILLFSESAGRFILTVPEAQGAVFEKLCKGLAVRCVGTVTDTHDRLKIRGKGGDSMVDLSCADLEKAFNQLFGEMI
jgi:phosphoribosylformylglycinamidine synthase